MQQHTIERKAVSITLAKAMGKYEEWMGAVGSAPKTIANNITALNAWARDQKIESTKPDDITECHISGWINSKSSNLKARTRAVNLSAIRGFFRFACSKGWTMGNPAQLVEVDYRTLDHNAKEVTERQPFTAIEVKRIIDELEKRAASDKPKGDEGFWLFAVRASSEIGLRLGDICQLEWACFQKDGKITLWTAKRNKRLELPISKQLAQLVTEIPVLDSKYIFPEQRGISMDPNRRSLFSVQFSRLLDSLKIDGKTFHSLRHMAATQKYAKADKDALAKKLAENLTLEQIASLLGHSETKTTKGYIHE